MFGMILAGKLKGNQHPCGSGVIRNQPFHQRRLVKRHLFDFGQFGISKAFRAFDQIGYGQVVAHGLRVLEVCDGVHPDGMGDLPGLFGQVFDDPKGLSGEDVFVLGLEDEENIIGLGVGILKRLVSE